MIKFSASLAEINMLNKLRELRLGAERKEREKRFYDYEHRKNKNNFFDSKTRAHAEPDVDCPFDGAHNARLIKIEVENH
jgi:hypothetical protein